MKRHLLFALKAVGTCVGLVALVMVGSLFIFRQTGPDGSPHWNVPEVNVPEVKPRPKVFGAYGHKTEDCEVIARTLTRPGETFSLDACSACQGAACEGRPSGCDNFPCRDGKVVVRGCDGDTDCEGLSRFCGTYASQHYVCVLSDPH